MANFDEKNDTKGVFLHVEFIFCLKKDIRECFGGHITNTNKAYMPHRVIGP